MISKINGTGSSHAAALKYAMEKDSAQEIASNNLYSKDAVARAQEMDALSNSARTTKPNFHASLSLPIGERGTDDQWQKAGEAYLKEMGFDLSKTQYVITRHIDSEHDHVHIIANRVTLDCKTVNMRNDRRRSHAATRVAERESSLHAYNEQEQKLGKGRLHELRAKVDSAFVDKPTLKQFKERLKKEGVTLKLNQSETTGRISGVSYAEDSGRQFKGSALGKQYSLKGLQDRGLQIDCDVRKQSSIPSIAKGLDLGDFFVSPCPNYQAGDGGSEHRSLEGVTDKELRDLIIRVNLNRGKGIMQANLKRKGHEL